MKIIVLTLVTAHDFVSLAKLLITAKVPNIRI